MNVNYDLNPAWHAACSTPIDWEYYDKEFSYPNWYREFQEEGLDTSMYAITAIFTSH